MNHRLIEGILKKAIEEQLIIKIRHRNNDFYLEMQPYIFGTDYMIHYFVWGFMPFEGVVYKFMFEFIDDIQLTDTHFEMPLVPNYTYGFKEKWFAVNKFLLIDGAEVSNDTNETSGTPFAP